MIRKSEDDSGRVCGVEETGLHLVLECPGNEEARRVNIEGARTL